MLRATPKSTAARFGAAAPSIVGSGYAARILGAVAAGRGDVGSSHVASAAVAA